MAKTKLIRITTVPLSLEKLLEGQLGFMQDYFHVTAVSSDSERLKIYAKNEGVAYFHLELTRKITPLKDLVAVYKLYRFLEKEKPEIVHTHTPKAGIVGMMAAYFAKVPNRWHTVAGLPLMETRGLKRWVLNVVEKLTYLFATLVLPNSRGLYNFIISEKFTSKEKLKIIGNGSSNGIDVSNFDPNLFSIQANRSYRKKWNIPENDFVFVFVGRLVGDKGINELAEAFTQLQQRKPKITLLLVGPLEEKLDPLNSSTKTILETNKKIVTTGYQDDVRPFFAMSDALVFPSYREGFPNVVLQAGAMGLPAIVSDINGCNEIISHKENGLLIPKKDCSAIHDAMECLVSDTLLFQKMQTNARPMITQRFDRNEIWQLLLNEYQALLPNA